MLIRRTKRGQFTASGKFDSTKGLKAVVLSEKKGEAKGEVKGCISAYSIQKGKVSLPNSTMKLLDLKESDQVIFTPLKGLL